MDISPQHPRNRPLHDRHTHLKVTRIAERQGPGAYLLSREHRILLPTGRGSAPACPLSPARGPQAAEYPSPARNRPNTGGGPSTTPAQQRRGAAELTQGEGIRNKPPLRRAGLPAASLARDTHRDCRRTADDPTPWAGWLPGTWGWARRRSGPATRPPNGGRIANRARYRRGPCPPPRQTIPYCQTGRGPG